MTKYFQMLDAAATPLWVTFLILMTCIGMLWAKNTLDDCPRSTPILSMFLVIEFCFLYYFLTLYLF